MQPICVYHNNIFPDPVYKIQQTPRLKFLWGTEYNILKEDVLNFLSFIQDHSILLH
jgi:hypothetical protein